MQKKKSKKNVEFSPKAEEFVLVRDEKGEFKYYYQGKFYSYDEAVKLLSPKEVKKLKKEEKKVVKEEKKSEVEVVKEMPLEKRDIEQQMLEEIAKKIIDELQISAAQYDNVKLTSVIISRLRGVRKDIEVKYMLTASAVAGGIGFDEQKAETILSTIKKYLREVEKKRLAIIRGEYEPKQPKQSVPAVQKSSVAAPAQEVSRRTLSGLDEQKPVLQDVTFGPSLVGPVDELRSMDLVNLRRLGSNKEEIMGELMERIGLLAEESIQKKVDGVNAWQQSPVYQMYLNIGYESIKQNKPIEEVINEKTEKGEKIMTYEEFQAIMESNEKMQF